MTQDAPGHFAGQFQPPPHRGLSRRDVELPQGNVRLRPAELGDMGFVTNAWHYNQVTNSGRDEFDRIKHLVAAGMGRADRIIIAANPDDDSQLFGCIVVDKSNVVEFVYVKRAFQRMGIARALVTEVLGPGWEARPVRCGSWSLACDQLKERFVLERT